MESNLNTKSASDPFSLMLDRRLLSEAIQHDIAAVGGQRSCDAETDPASRTRNDSALSFQHWFERQSVST